MSSKQRIVDIHTTWGVAHVTLFNRKHRKRMQRMHSRLKHGSSWYLPSANLRTYYVGNACYDQGDMDKLMQAIRNREWRTITRRALK